MIKLILYIFIVTIVVISMDSVNLNSIFKKGQTNYYQARLIYLMIAMSISYLTTNFIYDFIISFQIIK